MTPKYLMEQGLSLNFPERFWEKVLFLTYDGGCWIWTGGVSGGYGYIGRGGTSNMMKASQASWILNRGPIPDGFQLLHCCPNRDNRLCIRPDHLYLGTNVENVRDRMLRGNTMAGERGPRSKLTCEQVIDIRKRRSANEPLLVLANDYNVHPATISKIDLNQRWKEMIT